MKKILSAIFLSLTFSFLSVALPAPVTAGPCTNAATGCFMCDWDTFNNVCSYGTADSSNTCNISAFYRPNSDPSYCAGLTNQADCVDNHPCISNAGPYYCDSGTTCTKCPTGGCATGITTYSDSASCQTACNNTITTCYAGYGGTCKTSADCLATGNTVLGGTSPTNWDCASGQICCLPKYFCSSSYSCQACPVGGCATGITTYSDNATCQTACADPNHCVNQNGHCIFSASCVNGAPISSSDCTFPGFLCCPNQLTPTATSTDGVLLYCDSLSGSFGIRTAIGCIAYESRPLVIQLIGYAVKLAGGITLLSLCYAGFVFVTSFGDTERLAYARELFMSSVAFLIIITCVVVIINFLGVRILGLDYFGLQV